MSKINERCAGIDVGKRFLLCCVLTGGAHDEPCRRTLRFDTTVTALIRLREWLVAENITHVVMENTGSPFRTLEHQRLGDIVPGVFTPVLAKHTNSFNLADILAVGKERIQFQTRRLIFLTALSMSKPLKQA